MKRISVGLLVALGACASLAGRSGGPLVVEEGGSAQYGDLRVRLVSVEDSRCPPGAQCIREGEAVLTFAVNTATDDGTIRLRSAPADSAWTRYGAHTIRVDSVSPRPPAGGRYRAWIWVGR